MRLIEILTALLLLVPSYFITIKLIEAKLIDKLPDSNLLKKWWGAYYGFIIIGITFLLYPMANYFIAEPWVETPPLSEILNENNRALQELAITEIEIGTKSWFLEYKGEKLVQTNGHGSVVDGYELETNREDFYITEAYLLRGFRARYTNGKWLAKVPVSVTTSDVEIAKLQVKNLVKSIHRQFENQKKIDASW